MIEFRMLSPEEVADQEANRCPVFRGGKRSTVQCEEDVRTHYAGFHAGRGERGQWFTWRVSERDLGTSHRQDESSVPETDHP